MGSLKPVSDAGGAEVVRQISLGGSVAQDGRPPETGNLFHVEIGRSLRPALAILREEALVLVQYPLKRVRPDSLGVVQRGLTAEPDGADSVGGRQ